MTRPRIPPGMPDGIVAVVKHECETCVSIVPVLVQLQGAGVPLTVYTQDDPAFPKGVSKVVDDTELRVSWDLDLVTVPTVLRVEGGAEVARTEGWHRPRWEELTGVAGLGADLP
ncbi:MAG TPA: thioredoxin, partial [Acidimicrobiales bacterium]